MNQITVRTIPASVESRLRATADRLGLSLDQTDIRVLEAATGGRPDAPKRDLSEIAARWSDREAEVFDRVTAPFELVDDEMWR
jgi:plasmid stability protein